MRSSAPVVLAETDTIGVAEFPQIAAQIAGQVTAAENANPAPAGDDAPVTPVEFLEADLHDADLVPAAFADDLAAPTAAGNPLSRSMRCRCSTPAVTCGRSRS